MLSSLSRQLGIVIATFILITSAVVAVPAYGLIRSELQHQMLRRLDEAQRHTQTLLATQLLELTSLLQLTAERPTLQRLVEEERQRELDDYLVILRSGTLLDFLFVSDANDAVIAGTAPERMSELQPGDVLIGGEPPMVSGTVELPSGGYLTGGFWLDAPFIRQMAEQTQLEHSLILNGERAVTSLAPLADSAVPSTEHSFPLSVGGVNYYGTVVTLGNTSIELEVLMPVQDILTAERNALASLFVSALSSTLIGAALGNLYVRRIIRPLDTLTRASENIGRGQLANPIQVDTQTREIRLLADTLEQSRLNLLITLDKLSEARSWSEALIQAIAEGIVTFDADGVITFFSDGAARLTGWAVLEATASPLNKVLKTPSDAAPFSEQVPQVGERKVIQVNSPADNLITFAVTRAHSTQPGQMTIVLHDITEETHLRNLQTYFIANISHEFRTPLSGLRASIDLLLENAHYLSPAETDELLNSILLSLSSLQNLIDNLLESTKIGASSFALRRRETTFNTILAEAVRVMQPLLDRRNQRLFLTESFELPVLYADPVRLTQVLVNLLSNASKYSPQASIIHVRVNPRGRWLRVEIADQGEGVPPEARAEIFRRYLRREQSSSEDYGIGLGLFVVKSIVKEHGGEVGVDEGEGGGSVFWFTLPLTTEEQSA